MAACTRAAHPQTIFHLVPVNSRSKAVLSHHLNERCVSLSANGNPGLEVGYHVAARPSPQKLVEIGRNADFILPGASISAIQFSFEVHPDSKSIMLYDRSRYSTTIVRPCEFRSDGLCRQVVIQPDHIHTISAGGLNRDMYQFETIWLKTTASKEVEQGYLLAAQRPPVSMWARTVDDAATELPSWYNTRLQMPNDGGVQRFDIRSDLGEGAFGQVKKAVDLDTGYFVAVKKIDVSQNSPQKWIEREVRALMRLSHKNIVEYLGSQGWDTPTIYIFTPIKDGNTTALFNANPALRSKVSTLALLLQQMLEALDYLSHQGMIHRDVKPDNILYTKDADEYLFQLADFGLSRRAADAKSFCGTEKYMAPEMRRDGKQTSKIDVWSLFVSLMDLMHVAGLHQHLRSHKEVLRRVKAALETYPKLSSMAEEDANLRASAGQLLVEHFNGKGLTTPRAQIRKATDLRHQSSDPQPAAALNHRVRKRSPHQD